MEKLKPLQLYDEFKKMSSSQLTDENFLSEFIYHKVGLSLDVKKLNIKDELTCWNGMGLRQYPQEFAKLLVFLYEHKNEINSYFEIGVAGGASFFVIDSFLRAVNPDMKNSFGIDTRSVTKHKKEFDAYSKRFPLARFENIDSRKLQLSEHYDFCLVDGGHNQVDSDYSLVKNYAKIIAFHDIKNPLTKKVMSLWKSITGEKIELLNTDPRFPTPVGIGVLLPPYRFNPDKYTSKYYNRHLESYRKWENEVGRSIVKTLQPQSILDIGCGVGSYLEGALQYGCKDILGLDVSFETAKEFLTPEISPYIKYGDATKPLDLNRKFKCVMSFETGEHIESDKTGVFIDNLCKHSSKYIILTAAPPGQAGTGHINLREKKFWISEVTKRNFKFDSKLCDHFVSEWAKFGVEKYILRNLMVFKIL